MTNSKIKPHILFVRVTENCNASCFMCGFGKSKKQLYVSSESVKNIAIQAKKAGIKIVRFTGGEPLLHNNLIDYIKLFKSSGIKTSIITNGYLLPTYLDSLIKAELDQVILSIDGSYSALHDKLRSLPGAFKNATDSIQKIKYLKSNIIVRVNTVVSHYNYNDLENILDLLTALKVDQWSIIPIKSQENLWEKVERHELLSSYHRFQKKLEKTIQPRLLGYSHQWAGRNDFETNKYFNSGKTFTPTTKCNLVNFVRFYIPFTDRLLPCNCVPWRLKDVTLGTEYGITALTDDVLSTFVEYLKDNGPEICQGCEPINSYFAEHPEIIDADDFAI